jgi:hypothetical protein
VLFHERKAAPFQDGGPALRRDLESTEGDDPPEAAFQVLVQVLVAEEQHVRIIAVPPPAPDVLEPRPGPHLPPQELVEEFRERSLEAVIAAVEVVIGDSHVLAVAGDIDVLARPPGNLVVRQMALEQAR